MVAHQQVEAGGVAAAHLEPVDGRQRDLDRQGRLDGGDGGVGPGEGADLARGAQAVTADGPHRVACPDHGCVHLLQLGGHEGRAEAAVELGLHPVEPGGELVDAVADQQGRLRVAQQRPHAGHAPELAVDRLDLRRHLTERVGEATVRDTVAEPRRGPRRAGAPARRRPAPGGWRGGARPRRCHTWWERLEVRGAAGRAENRAGAARDAACSTSSTSRSAASAAASASVASTITRTSGSVPEGRTSTRPSSPSSSSTSRTRLQKAVSPRSWSAPPTATLRRTCGHPGEHRGQLGERPPAPGHRVEEHDPGEGAVAGGGVIGEDHVPRLLAAEAEVALLQHVEHVAVADRGLDHRDAVRLERPAQPEVRHHGGDDRVAAQQLAVVQVDGGDRQDLVAVDEDAALVDRDHAVGVAVEREPGVGAAPAAPPPGGRRGAWSRSRR